MSRKVLLAIIGALILTLAGGLVAAYSLGRTNVSLSLDGQAQTLSVRDATVGDVLASQGVVLGKQDVVQPALNTPVSEGLAIDVRFARPLEVTVDGKKTTHWVTVRNLSEALDQLQLPAGPEDLLSTSRSSAIGREGLAVTIVTAKDVTVVASGKATRVTVAGKVSDALTKLGITPDSDDIVTPAPSTELTKGAKITFTKVETKQTTREVDVAFAKKSEKSATMFVGQSKVKTPGVVGKAKETVTQTYHDGKLVKSEVLTRTVTKQPVAQINLVGTKARPVAAAQNLTPAVGASCKASYYWESQPTANGEWFNPNALTAAHKSLPFNTRVKVTNPANGKSVIVRINDRGPYIAGRCLDLSRAAMSAIGGTSAGVITVTYQVL